MARKEYEIITSLGDEDKLTVQKSIPLFALWSSDLTLSEFKILDTYLARIDSYNPDKRVVIFSKNELEEKLGVKKIKKTELEKRLKHLMGNVVKIPDNEEKKGYRLITLFEEAVVEEDEYEVQQVKLECTQKAMKYIFNIDNIGYLRYKLRCITSLTSRYSYIMFIYLEANRFRKNWNISLDALKELLGCDKEETYKEYKYFNSKILRRVQKELTEKTECKYTYEAIKKGRFVVAIHFEIETQNELYLDEVDENQIDIEEWLATKEENFKELWEDALHETGLSFSQEEIEELRSVLCCVPKVKLPQSDACPDSIDISRYHYMLIKCNTTNKRAKNKFAYLLKLLKSDAGIE